MRRTWNSWTFYGGSDLGRTPKGNVRRESVCQRSWDGNSWDQDSWKADQRTSRRWRSGEVARGCVEDAFEQSMADALERAMDLCDVRQERVARVRREIEAGTYWVPAEELARKLVRNMLGDYR